MQISQNWNNLSMTAAWGSNIASLYPGQRGRELMWTQKGTPTPRLQPQSPYLRHQLSLRVSPSMKATDGRSDLSWALLTNKVRRLSWLSLLAQGQHSLGTQNKSVFWRHPDARINILSIYSPTKQSWSPPGQATRKPHGADRGRHPQGHGSHSERDDEPPAAEETRAVERRRGRVFSSCATPHAGRRAGWEVLSPSWGCPLGQPDAKGTKDGSLPVSVRETLTSKFLSSQDVPHSLLGHSTAWFPLGAKAHVCPRVFSFLSLSAGRAWDSSTFLFTLFNFTCLQYHFYNNHKMKPSSFLREKEIFHRFWRQFQVSLLNGLGNYFWKIKTPKKCKIAVIRVTALFSNPSPVSKVPGERQLSLSLSLTHTCAHRLRVCLDVEFVEIWFLK